MREISAGGAELDEGSVVDVEGRVERSMVCLLV